MGGWGEDTQLTSAASQRLPLFYITVCCAHQLSGAGFWEAIWLFYTKTPRHQPPSPTALLFNAAAEQDGTLALPAVLEHTR